MINEIKNDAKERMSKSLSVFNENLSKMRTGRASTGLLDHVVVSSYGNESPLNQVANISATDSRMLTVTPWDKSLVAAIEKAILNADLGLNPMSAGNVIRVPVPALTEDRRKELVKVVRQEAESARVSIRNIRKDANTHLKRMLKDKEITEDEEAGAQTFIQKLTDKFIADVEAALSGKEDELMKV